MTRPDADATLTRRTQKGAGVMQMRQIGQMQINEDACVSGNKRTSSPYMNLTAYMQLRSGLGDQTTLSKDFVAL